MGFPPDTDTPGFAKENVDKPQETLLISESSGLQSPESVAEALMNSTLVIYNIICRLINIFKELFTCFFVIEREIC